ncbi:S10 family peptidase [Dyella telluris]|uniref:Peptidase S10 n=1 Tax=Dyella telluris TaxID=2763498 RepID=A0A7G8Q8R1_9GAMM|nr:peptidase S10 [Dyella telluris]QNK03169.1 peptidase S10 [Dyella telluris]
MKRSTSTGFSIPRLGALGLATLLAFGTSAIALAADTVEPLIAPVTTTHKVTIGGVSVPYKATFAELPLGDDKSHPQATMSATTYLRSDVRDASKRPVIFAFNGGPGASSTPLHLHALGPRMVMDPDKTHKEPSIVDNAYSVLDAADLVFIDPVGTGLSRVMPGGDGKPYWGPDSDAQLILGFMRDWLKEHHREQSPVFVAGESYGGYRLGTMMKLLGDQQVAGVILISPMLDRISMVDAKGNDQPYINGFPTMAAAAWFHQKVDRRGLTLEAFVADAQAFASSDYAVALQQGDKLPAAQRHALAQKMAGYIGLPAERIERADLRVNSEDYLNELLADQGLRLGRLDTRETGPLHAEAPKGVPTNDPSLHVSQKVGINDRYFRDELHVPTDRRYVGVNFQVNAIWNWADDKGDQPGPRFYFNSAPFIGDAAAKRPGMKILLAGGLFDMATPWSAARYVMDHAGIPAGRLTEAGFASGHSPYGDPGTLKAFSSQLHSFIKSTAAP